MLGVQRSLSGLRLWLWSNEQHENDGRGRRHRAETENHRWRRAVVAHRAQSDRDPAARADADHVHNSVAGRAVLWPDNLAQDGHIVRVEKSPADAEQNKERNRHSE